MPSLLERGPQDVLVVHRVNDRDPKRGEKVWRVSAAPTFLRAGVQPVREWSTSEEQFSDGLQMLDLRRVFTRAWPGDINAHAITGGELFETVGAPQRNAMSRRTRHAAVTLRRIGVPRRAELDQCAVLLDLSPAPGATDAELLAAVIEAARAVWLAARGALPEMEDPDGSGQP